MKQSQITLNKTLTVTDTDSVFNDFNKHETKVNHAVLTPECVLCVITHSFHSKQRTFNKTFLFDLS